MFKQRVYDEDVAQEETEADKKEKQVSHFCQFMNKLLPVFSFPWQVPFIRNFRCRKKLKKKEKQS